MKTRSFSKFRAVVMTATFGCMAAFGAAAGNGSAGAAGILPPANPPHNVAPSSSDYLTSINSARAGEGVGPMTISEATFDSLSIPEQIFVVVNLERIDRGLPAISYMTSQLDSYAQQGANAGSDPSFPSFLSGGSPLDWGGSIWAGGITSVLEADYYWMYSDGWGGVSGGTTNVACNLLDQSGCWGHRDIILHEFGTTAEGVAPVLSMGAAYSASGFPGGSMAAVLASSSAPPSDITMTWVQVLGTLLDVSPVVAMAPMSNGQGYWEAQANGVVSAFGQAQNFGSMAGHVLNSPIVGMAATPDNGGYWLVAADGGIFTFGDAGFYGSAGALPLVQPIVGMTTTPDGKGYLLVAADGGLFTYGDAAFHGSMGGHRLNQPIVGMATDLATGGYWLVAADGGIFSFGAPFFGSTGALHLVKPIVGMEAMPNGQGYRFEASDGGVFDFGQATFQGSMGGQSLSSPIVGMASANSNSGYWLVASDGAIFTFGGAGYFGRVDA